MRHLSTPWTSLLIGSFAVACLGDPDPKSTADSGNSETDTPDTGESSGGEGTGQTDETGQSDNGGDDDFGGECGDKLGDMSGTFSFGIEGKCLSKMFVAGTISSDPCPGCDFAFDVMYSEDFDECGFGSGVDWDIRTGSGNYADYFAYGGAYYDGKFTYYVGYGWYPTAMTYEIGGGYWVYADAFTAESGYLYYHMGYINIYRYSY